MAVRHSGADISGVSSGRVTSGDAVSGTRALPVRASLEHLRKEAKTLQKQHRAGVAEAVSRVAAWLAQQGKSRAAIESAVPLKLHDAQFALAREYGFASWPRLVEHFEAQHAAAYLRDSAQHLPEAAREPLADAAECYDRIRERLGKWDPADPSFGMVKQQKVESWTPEVRAREIALLRDVYQLEASAMRELARAL